MRRYILLALALIATAGVFAQTEAENAEQILKRIGESYPSKYDGASVFKALDDMMLNKLLTEPERLDVARQSIRNKFVGFSHKGIQLKFTRTPPNPYWPQPGPKVQYRTLTITDLNEAPKSLREGERVVGFTAGGYVLSKPQTHSELGPYTANLSVTHYVLLIELTLKE